MEYIEDDQQLIQREFNELLEFCKKRSPNEEELSVIQQAFDLANKAHKGSRRRSGEPYIIHPIEVAKIVVNGIGLGYKSVSAALLHDVVEDTDYTVKDIQRLFGDKISELVDGLTKIDTVIEGSNQSENFKRILLTLNNDVRVALIKLADRLHNMRTLESVPEHKRTKVIAETMYIYIPLAIRLGLYSIKTELENICLKYSYPEEYNNIQQLLDETKVSRENFIERFTQPICERLHSRCVSFELLSRTKSVFSIWNKMRAKKIRFEEVYDLFAIRIVFDPWPDLSESAQCYEIRSVINKIYPTVPNRTRDWVEHPKANGYEALHETVMGQQGTPVEVQIRSRRMDDIAKRGIAAHWRYKTDNAQESEVDKWLEHIREILENPNVDAAELLDEFHSDLTVSDMVVFTPKGESVILPKDATVLDFAYYIHSAIGSKAIAGKVNRQLVSLNHALRSGDQVEILTAENQNPQREWFDWVTTAKAKSFINEALKSDAKHQFKLGRDKIDEELQKLDIAPSVHIYTKLAKNYQVNNKEELFSKVGAGLIDLSNFDKILRSNSESRTVSYWGIKIQLPRFMGFGSDKPKPETDQAVQNIIDKKKSYVLRENAADKTLSYNVAPCCKPIPGDEVMGFIDEDNVHVTIHKKNCDEATRMAAKYGNRIIRAEWSKHVQQSFLVRLEIRGVDRIGILNDLTDIITGQLSVNIRKLSVESHDTIFEGYIDLYVHDKADLQKLINAIKGIKGMEMAKRAEKLG